MATSLWLQLVPYLSSKGLDLAEITRGRPSGQSSLVNQHWGFTPDFLSRIRPDYLRPDGGYLFLRSHTGFPGRGGGGAPKLSFSYVANKLCLSGGQGEPLILCLHDPSEETGLCRRLSARAACVAGRCGEKGRPPRARPGRNLRRPQAAASGARGGAWEREA